MAFAMMCQFDAQLFASLARAAEWRLSNITLQKLANAARKLATASQFVTQLFAALRRAVERCAGDFDMWGACQDSMGVWNAGSLG